jgi:hypothetical protein
MSNNPLDLIQGVDSLVNTDTIEIKNKYIDDICEDPVFLCANKELCGQKTTIYSSIQNVEEICKDISETNVCENDFKECVVLANNTFSDAQKYVSTSFENIIIPIPKAIDRDGNQKFLRLPKLKGRKKPNSQEICNICACMDRFARSPGSGVDDYTPPGQNTCVFGEEFEYFYYPLNVEALRNDPQLKELPHINIGSKYNLLNQNIINAPTEEALSSVNLYKSLTSNGISEMLTLNFILNVLYKNNKQIAKELNEYLNNPKNSKGLKSSFGSNGVFSNVSLIHLVIIGLAIYFITKGIVTIGVILLVVFVLFKMNGIF